MSHNIITSMYVGVLFHIRFLVKSFSAIRTWERPRVRMYQQMRRQRRASFEHFLANIAYEILNKIF